MAATQKASQHQFSEWPIFTLVNWKKNVSEEFCSVVNDIPSHDHTQSRWWEKKNKKIFTRWCLTKYFGLGSQLNWATDVDAPKGFGVYQLH